MQITVRHTESRTPPAAQRVATANIGVFLPFAAFPLYTLLWQVQLWSQTTRASDNLGQHRRLRVLSTCLCVCFNTGKIVELPMADNAATTAAAKMSEQTLLLDITHVHWCHSSAKPCART